MAARLSIVIPAYNEAARIRRTLDEVLAYCARQPFTAEVRVVDDGSRDETRTIVAEASRSDPRVVLQAEPHRGKGGAVRAGMLAATGDVRFLCDADLSMPIEGLGSFLERVPGRCDIAIGVREGIGARRVGEPEHRHRMGRVFNGLVRGLILPEFDDTQCGFKLFTADAAQMIFSRTTIDGWAFDVEALFLAHTLRLRVDTVPIEWHYRDRSQVSPGIDAFKMAADVVRIRIKAAMGRYR